MWFGKKVMCLTFLSIACLYLSLCTCPLHLLSRATRMSISGQKSPYHKGEEHCSREPVLLRVLQAGRVTSLFPDL